MALTDWRDVLINCTISVTMTRQGKREKKHQQHALTHDFVVMNFNHVLWLLTLTSVINICAML